MSSHTMRVTAPLPMPKTLFTASLFGWCLLSSIGAASAAPSPVPLLVEQCLRHPNIDLTSAFSRYANTHNLPTLMLSDKALVLEQHTIGLNNINDRLNYYRGLSLSGEERQGLLQCQLRLADILNDLLSQATFNQLVDELTDAADKHSNDEHLTQDQLLFGEQLVALLRQHQSPLDKAKLHTAQATIRQGLGSQQFHLAVQATQCQLPTEVTTANTENVAVDATDNATETSNTTFSGTIVGYLLKQPDRHCRQILWQAYQGRAREHNQLALHRIAELRQQMANDANFIDFASYSLAEQQLNSPALVKQFLDSQTESIGVAPWDVGRKLSQLSSAKQISLHTGEVLDNALAILGEYGLSFEVIDGHIASTVAQRQQQIIRVYHQHRLLGEVYLDVNSQHASASQHTLRQSVIGQQFGQQALELNPTLNSDKDIERFCNALAQAVVALARGSHFYLNNTLGPSLDSNQLPSLWLANVLHETLFPKYDIQHIAPREILAKAYTKQLNVFRAKVALNFYQSLKQQSYPDLQAEFSKSFGANWEQPIDYAYSFNAIANEGPRYYQSLWQTQLAKFVYLSTQDCQDKLGLFNLLVVNEAALTLSEQLRATIGDPVDAASLIQRIIVVLGSHANASNCAF